MGSSGVVVVRPRLCADVDDVVIICSVGEVRVGGTRMNVWTLGGGMKVALCGRGVNSKVCGAVVVVEVVVAGFVRFMLVHPYVVS